MLVVVIPYTLADIPYWDLLFGRIGAMGNTALSLFRLMPIQAPFSLQDSPTSPPTIPRGAVMHHVTPDLHGTRLGMQC